MSDHIETIAEFTEWVGDLSGRSILYRGLADNDWPVEASASRRIGKYSDSGIFKNYVLNLLKTARQNGLGTDAELCDLELLANLQHHGAATCLIDFTQHPLTALWFACKDEPEKDGNVIGMSTDNAELFKIVEPEQQKEKIGIFFEQEGLWRWQPRDINNRIFAQQSVFIFGKPQIEKKHYESVIIDKSNKAIIIEALKKYYNTSEVTLFRDISGFSLANAHNKIYTGYNEEEYSSLGVSAYQRRDFESVKYYCSEIIKINPDNANAYNNRGIAKAYLDDHKGAIKDYNKAIELDANDASIYNNRGNARDILGDHKDALEDFDKAIELNPNDAGAYNNRGVAKGKIGNHKGAIEDYDKVIELNPDDANAYYNRGVAKGNLSDHKDAIEDYDKAIELNPNDADAYNNRGVARRDLGDHKGAIEDYDKALELNPDFSLAYNNRGNARRNLGDHKGAEEDFTKFAELTNANTPDNASET